MFRYNGKPKTSVQSDYILKTLATWVHENEDRLVLSEEFWPSSTFQEPDAIDAWFDAQIDGEISEEDYTILEKEFLSFASTEEGGEYYLWLYSGTTQESAPVVFLGSSGEYDMIAPSLQDFVCMLGHAKVFRTNGETLRVQWQDFDDEADKLQDYQKNSQSFLDSFSGLVDCSPFEMSIKNMSIHKNFVSMIKQFVAKYSNASK